MINYIMICFLIACASFVAGGQFVVWCQKRRKNIVRDEARCNMGIYQNDKRKK